MADAYYTLNGKHCYALASSVTTTLVWGHIFTELVIKLPMSFSPKSGIF